MISNRPYLLRAFHQWIVDSGCTPILVMDATNPRCKIPQGYAEDGEIVFNVSAVAVRDFKITNELLEFKASFSSVIHLVSAPMNAILAIYAEENGEGIFFDAEEDGKTGAEIVIEPTVAHHREGTEALVMEPFDDTVDSVAAQAANKNKPFLTLVE